MSSGLFCACTVAAASTVSARLWAVRTALNFPRHLKACYCVPFLRTWDHRTVGHWSQVCICAWPANQLTDQLGLSTIIGASVNKQGISTVPQGISTMLESLFNPCLAQATSRRGQCRSAAAQKYKHQIYFAFKKDF